MTQIVYDGRYILADRVCTRGSIDFESVKLRVWKGDGIKRYWAFSGSFLECSLGDEVIESDFDKHVIEKVRNALPIDDLYNYYGLMVEVTEAGRKVYVINYAGDKCEVPHNKFIAVGAMYEEITCAYKVWRECASRLKVNANRLFAKEGSELFSREDRLSALAGFLRFVLADTMFDQRNYSFDSYDLEQGGLYKCV